MSSGVASGTNGLGVIVIHPVNPPWANRNPDSVVFALGPFGTELEEQAKLFTPVLWSIDAPTQAQVRVRREDTGGWVSNQAISVAWAAIWNR